MHITWYHNIVEVSDQNLLSRAPPCFGRHIKPLDPATFALVCTTPLHWKLQFQGRLTLGRRLVVKTISSFTIKSEVTQNSMT
jgi:hypothetical protein